MILLLLLLLHFAPMLPHNNPTVTTDRPLQITYLCLYMPGQGICSTVTMRVFTVCSACGGDAELHDVITLPFGGVHPSAWEFEVPARENEKQFGLN